MPWDNLIHKYVCGNTVINAGDEACPIQQILLLAVRKLMHYPALHVQRIPWHDGVGNVVMVVSVEEMIAAD